MADNVIRHDVVEVDFDIDLKTLAKLQEEIDDLRKKLAGDFGDDAFDELKRSAKGSADGLDKVKKAANGSSDGLDKVKKHAKQVNDKLLTLGKKGAVAAFNGLKKIAGISFKALAVGVGAIAGAVGKVAYEAVQAYADFEQLKGGVETLFKGDANTVMKYANDAYKTAGLSANEYMETVTSFSASLIASCGGDTAKAAKYANTAISDMSDNANKMGTDMGSIQYAYQGFAKQNYTMLDNLKLGYGGTKSEMERLLKDAEKISGIKYDIKSYSDVVQAIHVIQENMGITGTTQKEAEKTITGSLNSMKSAWGNLLTAMGSGENFDQCLENMVSSVEIFGKNVIPVAERALGGIGMAVEKLAPVIAEKFPALAEDLLPPLIKASVSLAKGLIKALPSIVKTVAETIVDIFGEQFPIIRKIGDFFTDNAKKIGDGITKVIPIVLGLVAAFKAFNGIKSIASIFGGFGGGSSKGGIFSGLTNTFKSLANTKPTVILKGMANIAIILSGFTILAAAFAAVAPFIAELSDVKSLLKVAATVLVLGVLSSALTKFAGVAGKTPVMTVVKGLANMAIMLAGMTVLTLAFSAAAPFIAQLADFKQILKVAGIIGILGVLGTALTIFAGIAGMIPIPVVLTGLANIALALGGMTAIVVAFGALSRVKGIHEFISTGGDLLASLFNVIGKVAGSLIGGLGEGLTASLPAIGENLAQFGKNIKPLFTVMNGVDMGGVGAFFTGLAGLLAIAVGNDIVSGIKKLFGGESSFATLGTDLSDFATNAKGFFTTVAALPENGFTNATALFDCLAGLKGLPKEGGVVGWFTGKINYETLTSGLNQLASEKVTKFFTTVATLKQAGFDNATALFDCLAGLKSLPKEGGVVGWFSGEVDYSSLATGLGKLASEDVKKFFTMAGSLKKSSFENTKLLFESLANIGDLPKEGGWWDKLTGNETTALGRIAEELSTFNDKTKAFFEQVNSLKLGNLNGLWNSLKKAGGITENVSKVVDDNIDDIVKKITELPKKMGDGLKKSGKSLADGLVSVWKDAVKASVAPVNKVLEAANWILKEFGSKKRVLTWTPYAKGTDGHKGGNALVNDGSGAELVQMPNGNSFIPKGRNVLIPNAPKGMKVLPADRTAQLMGHNTPTFRYAGGVGNIDIWSYIDNAGGLVSEITKGISYDGMSGFVYSVGKGMVTTFTGEMTAWVEKLFEEEGALGLADYVASKGVSQWRSTVIRALKMEGQYSAANVARTLYQMQTESGGNPKAINNWDSNAKKGTPSKGLMQVIDPTFKAYARSGFNKNIYDPLSNILASVRYATSRYGTLAKAYRGVGYENGGLVTKTGLIAEQNKPEMVIPLSADKRQRSLDLWSKTGEMLGVSYSPERDSANYTTNNATEYNTYAPQFSFTISGTNDDRAITRKVKRAVVEAWEDMLSGYESKMPKTQEV